MNIDFKEVGRRISRRRKELGLKQYEVCEKIEVNYKYISNLETGRSTPSLELIMSLCEALEATPDYFLLGTVSDRPIDNNLVEKLRQLDDKDKKLIDGILDLLIEQQKES